MSRFAKVRWNEELLRYELLIDGIIKAYAIYENDEEREEGIHQLVKLAEDKGYTAHVVRHLHQKAKV
jgi:hypothetical protein